MYDFGSILKKLRKQKRYTQQMLSENICSQSVLSRIENNEEVPNIVVMKQLCERLNVTIDQVMTKDDQEIREANEWLKVMSDYFYSKQYKQLKKLIEREEIANLFYSNEELQVYYYYLGSCHYYLDENYTEAIAILKMGLKCTYTNQKQIVTDMETQLMSCIGKVLADAGNYEKGIDYLEKSIESFYEYPSERGQFYLTKIFYNIASVYLHLKLIERGSSFIDQGITWAKKTHTFYFLDELYLLKGVVEEERGNQEAAAAYVKTAYYLKQAISVKNL